jgi:membrane peptidoglycan carboxypeptidase
LGEEPEIVVEPRRVKRSKPRRRGRVWLFRAIVALVAVGLLPIGLTLVYAVPQVRPVSTLMMLDLVTLRGYDRRWVALEDMGPNIVHAVMMSEDGQFCRHRGVDVGEFRALLEEALAGQATRGGSTITMQTVKNLYLCMAVPMCGRQSNCRWRSISTPSCRRNASWRSTSTSRNGHRASMAPRQGRGIISVSA